MKHFYVLCLWVLCVVCTTSCDNDTRDLVFFTGDAPIYQSGTCDNLTSFVRLYPVAPDGITVGIDGGDGNYSILSNSNEKVVAAAFVTADRYGRMQLLPKQMGESVISVSDGDGKVVALRVRVSEYGQKMIVRNCDIIVKGEVTVEKRAEIVKAMQSTFPFSVGGGFELVSSQYPGWYQIGVLRVYSENFQQAPVSGTYQWGVLEVNQTEKMGFIFKFNEKEYQFVTSIAGQPETRTPNIIVPLYEEVTAECPVECPEGVEVYRGYKLSSEGL